MLALKAASRRAGRAARGLVARAGGDAGGGGRGRRRGTVPPRPDRRDGFFRLPGGGGENQPRATRARVSSKPRCSRAETIPRSPRVRTRRERRRRGTFARRARLRRESRRARRFPPPPTRQRRAPKRPRPATDEVRSAAAWSPPPGSVPPARRDTTRRWRRGGAWTPGRPHERRRSSRAPRRDGDAAVEAALRDDLGTAKEVARRGGAFGEPSERRALNDGGSFSRNALSSLIDGVSDESAEDEAADAGDATRRARASHVALDRAPRRRTAGSRRARPTRTSTRRWRTVARRFRERAETAASIEHEISRGVSREPAARDSSVAEALVEHADVGQRAAGGRSVQARERVDVLHDGRLGARFRETLALGRVRRGDRRWRISSGSLTTSDSWTTSKDAGAGGARSQLFDQVESGLRGVEDPNGIAERHREGEAETPPRGRSRFAGTGAPGAARRTRRPPRRSRGSRRLGRTRARRRLVAAAAGSRCRRGSAECR